MRKPRKPPPRAARGISRAVQDLARERLESDLLGFVADSATEDPKHYIARMGAASVAMEHLKALAELAAEDTPEEEPAEPTADETLADARDRMSREDGT
jgi:hypothetical protein